MAQGITQIIKVVAGVSLRRRGPVWKSVLREIWWRKWK